MLADSTCSNYFEALNSAIRLNDKRVAHVGVTAVLETGAKFMTVALVNQGVAWRYVVETKISAKGGVNVQKFKTEQEVKAAWDKWLADEGLDRD